MTFNHKKKRFLTNAATTAIIAAGFAYAGGRTGWAQGGTPQVTVDRSPVVFSGQQPTESGGRILVPLRGVLEKLGAFVGFDNKTQTVTAFRGATRITLPIGGRQALVNDKAVTLDAPAQVVNGSTLVPLRFVAESLGAQVTYDVSTNTVAIVSGANAGAGTPTAADVPKPPANPPAATTNETTTIGTVAAVFADVAPPRLVLRVKDKDNATGDAKEKTIPLKANAKITIVRPNVTPDRVIPLARINVGDEVDVLQNGEGQGIAVTITSRKNTAPATVGKPKPAAPPETSGTFKGEFLELSKGNGYTTLKMTDGRTIDIANDAAILYENQKIDPEDLRSGDMLTIAVDPKTHRGSRVVVAAE